MTTAIANLTTDMGDMSKINDTALHMAKVFREATAAIRLHMGIIGEKCDLLGRTFNEESYHGYGFNVAFKFDGQHECRAEEADSIIDRMKRQAWEALINKLGVKNVMSVKKRADFEKQLKDGTGLPDITEETIVSVILGLIGQAQEFARDAALEVFQILRPQGHWGGQYKTNDAFRVGRRVILPWRVESAYSAGKFRPNYNREQELTAIDGVFHLLDGKGVMREHRGPLIQAIIDSPNGRGETAYFAFKCFKNHNLHLEMKRLDLVKELNFLAAGERVLGDDVE